MSPKFSQSFKKQAVEKALNRQDNTSLKEVADSLGVGLSSLSRWTLQAKNQELETISFNEVNNIVIIQRISETFNKKCIFIEKHSHFILTNTRKLECANGV